MPAGVAFGFLGPNGAGKTTMIRTLLGLTRPTSGDVTLLGLPQPSKRAEALARVGAIVEEPRFHPHLTGRENLKIVAAARDRAAEARIPDSLERVGLAQRADERVKTYSLGMRQRLGIARCLIADPALLILDEPMNGLDPAGILEMRHLIRAFVDEGRTVFLSSHLLDEVEKTCDQVAIVDQGRIVVQGGVEEIAASGDPTLLIEVDDEAAARRVLEGAAIEAEGAALRVKLAPGGSAAEINRALVEAGIAVSRLEPARATLEEKFLEITSRLEAQRMRLVRAEMLKLVRRRGLMVWSLLLTVGCVLVAEIVLVVIHAVNAAHHGPAGGADNFEHVVLLLTGVGTRRRDHHRRDRPGHRTSRTASSATWWSRAASGRRSSTSVRPARSWSSCRCSRSGSRSRSPCAYVFAGGLATPSASEIAKYAEYALAITGVNIIIAIGLGVVRELARRRRCADRLERDRLAHPDQHRQRSVAPGS